MSTPDTTPARRIAIYDTTLRDGTQGEGFNLSLEDKLQIAIRLEKKLKQNASSDQGMWLRSEK